ncbi:hypothetical protein TNCV_1030761 [Trichonephila clavipes]|nr:hypothetical protein TNCV_1030761 [Trichonephila clavipes]
MARWLNMSPSVTYRLFEQFLTTTQHPGASAKNGQSQPTVPMTDICYYAPEEIDSQLRMNSGPPSLLS